MLKQTASWRYVHLALGLTAWLLVLGRVSPLHAQPAPGMEVYQDFREQRPLLPSLQMYGPDIDAVVTPEKEGLRVTLPKTREVNQPIEIATKFSLVGDFEVTATYELLAADQPAKGYGVGVSLNVADSKARDKFAWVARMMRPGKGSVYASENWDKAIKGSYRFYTKPSDVKVGQLRLVRSGAKLLCLASDGPGKEFSKINEVPNFGSEEMARGIRFQVVNSGSPGNAVDARLIDLRIRHGSPPANDLAAAPGDPERKPDPKTALAKAATPAPLAAPAPRDLAAETPTKGWLAAALFGGFALILCFALVLGAWLYLRQRGAAKSNEAAAAPAIALACSDCGKKLKVKPELIGKKVKCPQCGKVLPVP